MDNNVSQVKTSAAGSSDKTIMNINNKLSRYTSELSKKVASLKEESKEKTDAVKTYIKEDSPFTNTIVKCLWFVRSVTLRLSALKAC